MSIKFLFCHWATLLRLSDMGDRQLLQTSTWNDLFLCQKFSSKLNSLKVLCIMCLKSFNLSCFFPSFNICSPPPPFLELFLSTGTLWEKLLHSALLSELNYWFTPYLKWFVPRPWSCVLDFSWHLTIKTSYHIMNPNFHSRFLESVGYRSRDLLFSSFLICTVCCRGAWSALDCGVGVGNTWR